MTNQVIATGLPWTVSGEQLALWCRQVVPVSEAHVFVDPITSRSKGKGLITFESVNDAAQAVQDLKEKPLAGKLIFLEIATPTALAEAHAEAGASVK